MKTCLSSVPNLFAINLTQFTCRFVFLQIYIWGICVTVIFPSSPHCFGMLMSLGLTFTFSNICYHEPASCCFSTLQIYPLTFICHSFNNAKWNLHCILYPLHSHPFNIITGISYKSLFLYYFSYPPIIEYNQQNPSTSTYSSLSNAFPFTQKNSSFVLESPIHGSCFVIFIIKFCRNKPTYEKLHVQSSYQNTNSLNQGKSKTTT